MKTKTQSLSLADFGVLTVIFFGYFIFTAIAMFVSSSGLQPPSAASFTDDRNVFTILIELVLLSLAGLYLWWRKFEWAVLRFRVGWHTLALVPILILLGSLVTDVCIYGSYWVSYGVNPFAYFSTWYGSSGELNVFGHITIGLLLFALLNGFFEELYFMGFAFAADRRYRVYAIVGSVVVRFSFHIYQGIPSALGIALTGVAFILVRRKVKSLVPFMLAHSFFDLFGAGVVSWICMFFYS